MPALLYEADFKPGDKSWHPSDAPVGPYSVVFEDDGDTGYFYACDAGRENRIVDAVHIYNVNNVTDRHKVSKIQIGWTADGIMAVLLINKHPHAVVDFATREFCCRTGFPPASGEFASSHDWNPAVVEKFKRTE